MGIVHASVVRRGDSKAGVWGTDSTMPITAIKELATTAMGNDVVNNLLVVMLTSGCGELDSLECLQHHCKPGFIPPPYG